MSDRSSPHTLASRDFDARPLERTRNPPAKNALLFKAALIALVPFSALRRWLYRTLMGFQIPASSSIGMLTLMAVPDADIGEHVIIGPLNIFKGPYSVSIGDQTRIGRNNRFYSSWKIMSPRFAERHY